ncbi:hypothetical protein B0H17DRAFT_1128067 [Mycena rosella]|uniref:Uncharacterized protein n=1 Tax=Mycena rosella TaxID=1033263 RepID=A0AAD7DZS3_MYCRO|nr:hypothetical protein B0H17DRAFT_1128067 [Mycena rosella]
MLDTWHHELHTTPGLVLNDVQLEEVGRSALLFFYIIGKDARPAPDQVSTAPIMMASDRCCVNSVPVGSPPYMCHAPHGVPYAWIDDVQRRTRIGFDQPEVVIQGAQPLRGTNGWRSTALDEARRVQKGQDFRGRAPTLDIVPAEERRLVLERERHGASLYTIVE